MRAIDRTLVDEVWREVTVYAPARIASEAQVFLELQPHAAAFSQAYDETVRASLFCLLKTLTDALDLGRLEEA